VRRRGPRRRRRIRRARGRFDDDDDDDDEILSVCFGGGWREEGLIRYPEMGGNREPQTLYDFFSSSSFSTGYKIS
jgi:hypothetical protein